MILIKNAAVFAPGALGLCDILIGGGKILAIEISIMEGVLPGEVEIIDAGGLAAVPGFIDGHQHFTGGGGEGGSHPHAGNAARHEYGKRRDNGGGTAVNRFSHPLGGKPLCKDPEL
jgi:dihydroorotase-like cyclic amidohydrolase